MPTGAERDDGPRSGNRPAHPDRDVRILYGVGGASAAALLPYFVLLLRARGLAPDAIGLVLAVSSLAGVAAIPVWSNVADTRLGTVRALRLASVASALIALALIPADALLWALVLVSAARGVVEAPTTALSDTLALSHLGPERMTEYGAIRLWASGGWAVAVVAFGALFQREGLELVVPAYAAGMLVFALATTRFAVVSPARTGGERSKLGSVGEAFRLSHRLVPFLVGLLLVSTATSAAWSFVPLRIATRGGGPFLVGVAAGLSAVVEIPFFAASAWLGRHVPLRMLYVAGCGVYVATMVGWALLANPVVVAAIKVAGGAGFGLVYAALVVITGRLVPERLRVTGQALMQTAVTWIGPIVGAAVGGVVYGHLGAATMFAWAAAFAAVGAGVVWTSLSADAFSRAAAPAAPTAPP